MPIPNNGLITETNRQYYEGAQGFIGTGTQTAFITTFNTDLIFGDWNPANTNYALNNFKLYTSPSGLPGTFSEYLSTYTVVNNVITITPALANGVYLVVQLKILDGGNYATTIPEKAFGNTTEENYGSYAYTSLNDIINNCFS